MTTARSRYSRGAMVLHWLIAAAVLAMIPMGIWMSDAITDPDSQQLAYRLFQLHKSIGFTILALTVVRIGWRLAHPVPQLPERMAGWERIAARLTHWAFYGLLLLLPLTGWIYVSAGWSVGYDRALNVPTSWFGLFQIPHLPFVSAQPAEGRRLAAFSAMAAHATLAFGGIALVVLHVAAALKHQFRDRDNVMASMVPWMKLRTADPTTAHRGPWAAMAGVLLAVVLCVVGGSAVTPPTQAVANAQTGGSARAPVAAKDQPIIPGTAAKWAVDQSKSSIGFGGEHAGKAFKGRFEDWEAYIWFDPADLPGSKAVVIVRTGSARTGDATQEGSLQEAEWFGPKLFPEARFQSTGFRALGGDRYEAQGTLRVKDRSVPVTLPFTLKSEGARAKVEGMLTLDRTALNLGMFSDPGAEWVSREIEVTVEVEAKRGV